MDDDNYLYNAMIWALSIGIIIVIATLFLTKPAPESFTELYFNNHTSLPEYVNQADKYNYSFTIHNLENTLTTYNYSITTELYKLDYSCEKPDLYLESQNDNIVPTRKAESNDQALLIKEQNYNISFNYDLKQGNHIRFAFLGIDNKEKYAIDISNESYFITPEKIIIMNITKKANSHKFTIIVDKNSTTLKIDTDTFYLNTPKDYTIGFPSIETIDTYAEIYNFVIDRQEAKQGVNIRIADAKYQDTTLKKIQKPQIIIQYTKYLSQDQPQPNEILYNKIFYQPIIQQQRIPTSIATYYSANPINLTSYSVLASFRPGINSMLKLGLENITAVYNMTTNNLTIETPDVLVEFNVTLMQYNNLIIDVNNNTAAISFNGINLLNVTGNNLFDAKPYLQTYNYVQVSEFSTKGNIVPVTINYKFPDVTTQSYAGLYTTQIIRSLSTPVVFQNPSNKTNQTLPENQDNLTIGLSDYDKQRLEDFFNREKINWTNYRIVATYMDKNNSLAITFRDLEKTMYAININDKNKTLSLAYTIDGIEYNISKTFTLSTINRLVIDETNGTVTVNINDKTLTTPQLTNATNGLVAFDYQNITLLSAQAEDKDSNTIRIYKRQTNPECNPILVNRYIYNNDTTILDKHAISINGFVKFNESFDIAKVQIDLDNGEEVHFWVKSI